MNNVWYANGIRHNHLSISQFCDNGCRAVFNKNTCTIIYESDQSTIFIGQSIDNIHKINFSHSVDQKVVFLLSVNDEKWLWHKRLEHANRRLISKLVKLELVKGLLELHYHSNALCRACERGKIVKTFLNLKTL
jgi:hypothetical protein